MTPLERPTSWLWSVYEHVAMVLGLSALAVVCLSWTPLAIALYPVLPTPLGRWLGRQAIMRGFRLYVGVLRTVCACRFDLSAIDARTNRRGNDAFVFIENADFSGKSGELRVDDSESTLALVGDRNGDGIADFLIEIARISGIEARDLIL